MMNVRCYIIGGSEKVISIKTVRRIIQKKIIVRVCRIAWRAPGTPDGLVRNPKKMFGKGGGKNLESDLIKCLSIIFK